MLQLLKRKVGNCKMKRTIKNLACDGVLLVLLTLVSTCSVRAVTLADYLQEKNEKLAVMEGHAQTIPQHSSSEIITNSQQDTSKASTLARAMAKSSLELTQERNNITKTLILEVSELKDSSGLVYLGGKVAEAELSRYLSQLKRVLGAERYTDYRQHQAARDHQSFHVTLVNPYEYQTINKENLSLSKKFKVTLHGLGKVAKGDKESFFVVASSAEGQFIRQNLLLKNKDFHVTLGFYPEDVFGVSKGRDTLINK